MSAQHCTPAAGGPARELISFRVSAQEFCIDIMAVREIQGWTPATPLPHAPAYMRRVVNLRGAVLPIVDLAERLGFGAAEPTPSHVIIVTEVGAQVVGLLAVLHGADVWAQLPQPRSWVRRSGRRSGVQGPACG